MTEREVRSLTDDVTTNEYSKIIGRVGLDLDKLVAHIIADGSTCLISDDDPTSWRLAETHLYEIVDLDFIIPMLERYHWFAVNSPLDFREEDAPKDEVMLKRVITPEGETVKVARINKADKTLEPVKIRLSRFSVVSNPDDSMTQDDEPQSTKQTRSYPPETSAWRYFESVSGLGDFFGYLEFALRDPEVDVDEGEGGSIIYTKYDGVPKIVKRTTIAVVSTGTPPRTFRSYSQ